MITVMLLMISVQEYKITIPNENKFVTPDHDIKNVDTDSHYVTPKRMGRPKKSTSKYL